MWKTKHWSATTKAQVETQETLIKTQKTTLTTWKPPHVDKTQSILQLHHEGDYRRRCEQQLRDVMANVGGRHETRPFGVVTNLGREEWNNMSDKDIEIIHWNLGTRP